MKGGAGVLVFPNLADCGGALALHWSREMRPWGVQIRQACVLDRSRGFEEWRAYAKSWYCWTENPGKHPAVEGATDDVSRVVGAAAFDCPLGIPSMAFSVSHTTGSGSGRAKWGEW